MPNHSVPCSPKQYFDLSSNNLCTIQPSLRHLDVTQKRSFSPFPRKNLHSSMLASIYENLHSPATPNHSARRALNRKLGHPLAFVAPSKSLVSPSKRHVLLFLLVLSRCNIFHRHVPVVPLNFTRTRIAASALSLSSFYSISPPPHRLSHHSNPSSQSRIYLIALFCN